MKVGMRFSSQPDPKTLEERIQRARDLVELNPNLMTADHNDFSKVRVLVDDMDDSFDNAFMAHPDKVFIIEDGRLVYSGRNLMSQVMSPLHLMTDEIREWLEKRQT
ncbi:uncharacterized protein [Ptychodera flava]|uniref:uncharacterized protein n=1 Tax=Ptychodera flava TaxID=63121 RepID=UPI003969DF66